MKPVYLLIAAMIVAGIAGLVGSDRGEAPRRVDDEPRPLPASAVQVLDDPHAGTDMESNHEHGEDVTEEEVPGEMPDDDIHRGMR